jgi:hypothetical protein
MGVYPSTPFISSREDLTMAPLTRPQWGFTKLTVVEYLAANYAVNAHWPLDSGADTWVQGVDDEIEEVLGGSDGTEDWWTNVVVSEVGRPTNVPRIINGSSQATALSEPNQGRNRLHLGEAGVAGSADTFTAFGWINISRSGPNVFPTTDIWRGSTRAKIKTNGSGRVIFAIDAGGTISGWNPLEGNVGTLMVGYRHEPSGSPKYTDFVYDYVLGAFYYVGQSSNTGQGLGGWDHKMQVPSNTLIDMQCTITYQDFYIVAEAISNADLETIALKAAL